MDTLPNIPLPPDTWVDLYAESGLTVGDQLLVQNIGAGDIYLESQAAQPPLNSDSFQILSREKFALNDLGDSGAWALSNNVDGLVNVRLA